MGIVRRVLDLDHIDEIQDNLIQKDKIIFFSLFTICRFQINAAASG